MPCGPQIPQTRTAGSHRSSCLELPHSCNQMLPCISTVLNRYTWHDNIKTNLTYEGVSKIFQTDTVKNHKTHHKAYWHFSQDWPTSIFTSYIIYIYTQWFLHQTSHSLTRFITAIIHVTVTNKNFIILQFSVHISRMGRACSLDGGGERRVQVSGGETWGKETTGETQA
jgi:hypothetical protein